MPTIHNKPQVATACFPFIVYLLIVLSLGTIAPAQAANGGMPPMAPAPGLIYDVARGDYVRLETLQSAAAGAKYILLGETHDNLIHHQRQAELIDVLSGDGLKRAVVWEMINRDQQSALDDAWNNKKITIDDIGNQLNWEDSGWPLWQDYSPIAEAARQHQLPMVAGNLPKALIAPLMAKGNGALPTSLAKKLALPPIPAETKTLFDREIVNAHCGVLSPEQAPPFSTIQFARDASLARAMFDATRAKGIKGAFLITGAMHARANIGVPWHLRRFDPKGTSIVITMLEAPNSGDPSSAPADSLKAFGPDHSVDFIWFTSDLDRSDPCEGIKMPHAPASPAPAQINGTKPAVPAPFTAPQSPVQQPPAGDGDQNDAQNNTETGASSPTEAGSALDDIADGDDRTDNLTDHPSAPNDANGKSGTQNNPAPAPTIDPEPSNNPMRRIMPIPPARPKD
ncbi:ChaN family lipoprotein [Thalassospira mesophila]|uniref:ChaN family lipoprotein n=1 Tax=Thalassospira mesophila TaxID=1293891 RepID=UPI000A1DE590|nr:ChaN family lipoprotein [Thalassospira mesophila]